MSQQHSEHCTYCYSFEPVALAVHYLLMPAFLLFLLLALLLLLLLLPLLLPLFLRVCALPLLLLPSSAPAIAVRLFVGARCRRQW